ncbi:hypothetical protein AB5J62_15420 [Amycolatopsis sp. cg5]|uniref:hypothetical protein n=1 Tax=Amycolatopsis sp. cg5 TaxID=3238802 RepID=UPI00352471FD
MAEQGFVSPTPDPDDRRRNLVTLTEAGDRQLRRLEQVAHPAAQAPSALGRDPKL